MHTRSDVCIKYNNKDMDLTKENEKALYPFKVTLNMLNKEYDDCNNNIHKQNMLDFVMEWYNTKKTNLEFSSLKNKDKSSSV